VTALTTSVSLPLGSVLDRAVDRQGCLRAVALLRALIGAVVVRHLWPDVRESVLPVDRFHVRWWSWLPVPSHAGYRFLLWIGVAAGVAMVLGVAVRLATATALAVVAYLLVVDMTGFAHNRAFLVWILFGLSLLPTGAAFTVTRWRTSQHGGEAIGYVWPLLLMRFIVSSVYLTSGATKLSNPDWRSGLVLWDRVVRHEHHIPFAGWIHDVLTSRWFYELLSPAAIAVELFIGTALWCRHSRLAAIWIAIVFHASIEVAAAVQTFSYTAIAALLIWVTPATADRTLAGSPRLLTIVDRLDWLHRFQITPTDRGATTTLVDRDGSVHRGGGATLTALSRLPLLFVIVAPVLAAHRLRHRRPTRDPHRRHSPTLTTAPRTRGPA
jgi:hypothetical protein